MEVTLGSKYKDEVTGLVGTATARCVYLDGQIDILLEDAHDAKIHRNWVSEKRLVAA